MSSPSDQQAHHPDISLGNGPATPAGGLGTTTSKLRSSCDQCTATKIRCAKNKPTCERCSTLGLACNYSPYRWKGRPSTAATNPMMATSPPAAAAHVPLLVDSSRTKARAATQTTSPRSPSSHSSLLSGHESYLNAFDLSGDNAFFVATPAAGLNDDVQWESTTLAATDNSFPGLQMSMDATGFTPSCNASDTSIWPSNTTRSSLETDLSTAPSRSTSISHACVVTALDALRTLHEAPAEPEPPHDCDSAINSEAAKKPSHVRRRPATGDSAANKPPQLSTDQALKVNRNAFRNMHQMLTQHCDKCASDASMDLLFYTVCSRMLSRYQSIFDSIAEQEQQQQQQQQHPPYHRDRPSVVMMERLHFSPLEFGEFPVDMQAARCMNAQLLLHELKCLAKLHGQIRARGGNPPVQSSYQPRRDRADSNLHRIGSPYYSTHDTLSQVFDSSVAALTEQIDTFCQTQWH